MKSGIYFLVRRKRIVYIGQTKNYPNRLWSHRVKDYDSVRFIECPINKLLHYEGRLISYFKPKLNGRVGAPKKLKKDKVSALTITVKNETIEKKGGSKACKAIMKEALEILTMIETLQYPAAKMAQSNIAHNV